MFFKISTFILMGLLGACNSGPSSATSARTSGGAAEQDKSSKENKVTDRDSSGDIADDPGSELVGVWETECLSFDTGSFIGSMEVTDKQAVIAQRTFSDSQCAQLSHSVFSTNSYTLGELAPYTNVATAREFNLILLKTEALVESQVNADALNTQAAWGLTNWQAGVRQDVSGRRLDPTANPEKSPGEPFYQLIAVQDRYMVLGNTDTGDGLSPVTRPRELATGAHWRKIKP
ncbi:MAG: hypothetical protein AB7T49_15160 [Oligoflexales bacterium]